MHINSKEDNIKICLEKVRREYSELKRGGNVDPLVLKEEISSLIDIMEYKNEGYEDLRAEAEDMLIDVSFMVQEGHCAPFRAKSIK